MSKKELRRQLQYQEEIIEKIEKSLTRARKHYKDSDYRRQERIRLEHLSGSEGQVRDETQLSRARRSEHDLEELLQQAEAERERLRQALREES